MPSATAEQAAGSDLDPAALSELVIYNEQGQVRFRVLAYLPGDAVTPATLAGAPSPHARHLRVVR